MKDTLIYNHNFPNYSVELCVEVEVYKPRHPDIDDVAELQILSATVMENVGSFSVGQKFNVYLLDNDKVTEVYFNN